MSITLNPSIVLRTIHNLNDTQGSLNRSLNRVSSGLRINRAADDAVGLTVASRMNSDLTSARQSLRNTNDGISLVQTAEGALSEVHNLVVRLRELTVQSLSDTINTTDRGTAIHTEMDSVVNEINRIASTTNFNRVNILRSTDTAFNIQVGIFNSSDDSISIDMSSLNSSCGAIGMLTMIASLDAGSASLAIGGTAIHYSAWLDVLDTAGENLGTRRAKLGAIQNRLESALSQTSNQIENLSASQSRILDVDYASESASLMRFKIQNEAGVAALSQAKGISQSIISLLS